MSGKVRDAVFRHGSTVVTEVTDDITSKLIRQMSLSTSYDGGLGDHGLIRGNVFSCRVALIRDTLQG